jgi:hypothetical protein
VNRVKQTDGLWLCFFRGLNAFGRGTILMHELEGRCRAAFVATGLPIRFVDYYDSKGNIAVLAPGVSARDVSGVLFRAIPKPCALAEPGIVAEVSAAFSGWPAPAAVSGFRWTPGVSMLCDGSPSDGGLDAPDLGVFTRLTPRVVVLYRKERETERRTLHRDRKGGWAAVSSRTERTLGGSWTARSFDVVRSLLAQAHRKLSADDSSNPNAT